VEKTGAWLLSERAVLYPLGEEDTGDRVKTGGLMCGRT